MNADPPAPRREIQSDAAPESAPRTGHEHGPGILVLGHAVLWKNAWPNRIAGRMSVPAATLGDASRRNKAERAPPQLH